MLVLRTGSEGASEDGKKLTFGAVSKRHCEAESDIGGPTATDGAESAGCRELMGQQFATGFW